MDAGLPTAAAYLLVGAFCAAWFWRIIRSTGHPADLALMLVSAIFGVLWPIMMPGVALYRWMLPRPIEFREDLSTPAGR